MGFDRLLREDRRLALLRILNSAPQYTAHDSMLHDTLSGSGRSASLDMVQADLAWLEDQGLVTIETIAEVVVVRITQHGVDTAAGRARVPGVKRPSPLA